MTKDYSSPHQTEVENPIHFLWLCNSSCLSNSIPAFTIWNSTWFARMSSSYSIHWIQDRRVVGNKCFRVTCTATTHTPGCRTLGGVTALQWLHVIWKAVLNVIFSFSICKWFISVIYTYFHLSPWSSLAFDGLCSMISVDAVFKLREQFCLCFILPKSLKQMH